MGTGFPSEKPPSYNGYDNSAYITEAPPILLTSEVATPNSSFQYASNNAALPTISNYGNESSTKF